MIAPLLCLFSGCYFALFNATSEARTSFAIGVAIALILGGALLWFLP